MLRKQIGRALGAALICVFAAAAAAQAQSVEKFYKGKRVKMIVGGSPGGGYDTYARAFARYYKNYIPGKPSIIAQNMQGAGGIRATNYIASGAVPRDGSVFATSLRTVATEPLFHPKAVKYDATKLNWLGSLANEISICVTWHTSPVKTFKDALQKEVIMGASNGNSTEFYPAIFNNLLGTKFKIVVGYVAVGINVAMERGEVAGRCSWSWTSLMSQRPDWVRDKKDQCPGPDLRPAEPARAEGGAADLRFLPRRRRTSSCLISSSCRKPWAGPISCPPACRRTGSRRCARRSIKR